MIKLSGRPSPKTTPKAKAVKTKIKATDFKATLIRNPYLLTRKVENTS